MRRRRRPGRTSSGEGLRVGLFGVLGSGNWGNDGSLEVILDFLRGRFPDARLGFMAMGPDCVEARYGIAATHLQWYEDNMDRLAWVPETVLKLTGRLLDPVRTLRWVRRFDVVIVPGAGVFETTTPTRPWGLPYSLLALGLAARLTGTRLAYVCVGANATRDAATRSVLAGAAWLAHYRSYRDELSRDAVRDMGVDVGADSVYPDLAFAIDVPPKRAVGDRVVGVGVMNYYGGNDDRYRAAEIHESYLAAVKRFVGMLVDEGWQVRLFTGDKEDEGVLQEILDHRPARRGPGGDVAVVAESVHSLAELMKVLAEVDLVVASRYHNVLAALKLAIPTLSISYATKNDVLMTSMGLGEFCHPAGEIDFDRLVDQFRGLERRRGELVDGMVACNRANHEGVARQLDDLAGILLDHA